MKLYATSKINDNTYILSSDVEKDARQAEMTLEEYMKKTKELNPTFRELYLV